MRKRLMSPILHDRLPFDGDGPDLANLGTVEITSEDEAYPIECALQEGERRGWACCRGWTSCLAQREMEEERFPLV
jgi:hypothetical protein